VEVKGEKCLLPDLFRGFEEENLGDPRIDVKIGDPADHAGFGAEIRVLWKETAEDRAWVDVFKIFADCFTFCNHSFYQKGETER